MKKYIKSNWKSLILAITFSVLASIFAVRVQFLKGDVLDYALLRNFDNTLRYGLYLGAFIVLELGFFYFYDRKRGKFAVNSMKEVRLDYFKGLLDKDYPSFLKKNQGEYIAQYTNEMEIIENHIKAITDWLNGFEIIKNFSIEKNIKEKFIESNDNTMVKKYWI